MSRKYRIFKYLDCTFTEEHFEPFDGEWKHKEDTIIIEKNYNFYEETKI